jgi:hypothetical protein
MALNLVSPGVKIREVDLTVGGITAGSNQVGAIAGPFQKGPVNEPILIETENDLLNVFGKPISSDSQYEYWLSASSFLSYGAILRVVRCDDDSLKTANAGVSSASADLKIESVEDYDNNHTSDTSFYWASRNPGSWANKLKVCIVDNLADQRIAITTSGLAVGYGVSTSYTRTSAGVGTTSSETGVLKGIITQVNVGSIDVKILSKNVGGVDSEVSYQQGGTYEFKSSDSIGINSGGTLVRVNSSTVTNISAVVSTGSTVVLPGPSLTTGATPFVSAGYAVGQFVRSVTDNGTQVPLNTIVGFGTTNVNGLQQDTLLLASGSPVSSGTIAIGVFNATTSISAPSDWYDQQTLGLTNSTVYWKNIAPKPATSQYAAERSAKNDEINIVVVDDTGAVTGVVGNILEKYQRVSKASDGKISPNQAIFYKDIIREQSQYIFAGIASTGVKTKFSTLSGYSAATDTTWGLEAQGNTFNCVGAITYELSGGADYSGTSNVGGYSVDLSNVISSYRKFTNPAEYSIDYLISGPSGGTTIFESQAKANELIAIADLRKDCIAVISPHRSGVVNVSNSDTQTNNIVEFFDPLTSSSYAVFDSGYKYTYDRFNNTFRYIPCNADIAGLMARTAINSFPWYSPAGSSRGTINNATKLAYNPSQAQRDRLYTTRINPIIFSQGAGIILFGDKTGLSYTSAFDRINVRRLFLTIERAIERAARAQLFEFNDLITRSNFVNIVEPYLRDVKAKRGVSDYVVICDETNNTPDIIDSNQFKADIYVKPARSINFIGLTFVATRTGVSFEEVIGTV